MGLLAIAYSAAAVVVAVANGISYRFGGRDPVVLGAYTLSGAFLAAQLLGIIVQANVPLPWSYLPAILFNFALLLVGLDLYGDVKKTWIKLWSLALVLGLALQVALWASWFVHRHETYNWTLYSIYLWYARLSRVLNAMELGCVAWGGVGPALVGWTFHLRRRHRLSGAGRPTI